jgi:hypothetical protein
VKTEEPSIALELERGPFPHWVIAPFSVNHLDEWRPIKEQMLAEILLSIGFFE